MKKSTKSKKTTTKTQEKKDNDYYTPEEERRLDYFHEETGNKFTDEEIYDLIVKYKDDDEAILNDLKEKLKDKRGEGEWNEIGKRNYISFYIILFYINRW